MHKIWPTINQNKRVGVAINTRFATLSVFGEIPIIWLMAYRQQRATANVPKLFSSYSTISYVPSGWRSRSSVVSYG